MKPLKDIYTHKGIFRVLAKDFKRAYPRLDEEAFYHALTKDLQRLELKARIERAADTCRTFLPREYSEALHILYRFVKGKKTA